MPYAINSRALTDQKPCFNKEFFVLLLHRKKSFQYDRTGLTEIIPPRTLNRWRCNKLMLCCLCFCNFPIKTIKKKGRRKKREKKCSGRALNPVFQGHSAAHNHYAKAACTTRHYKCIFYPSLLHDVISLYFRYYVIMSWNRFKTMLFSYFNKPNWE